MHPDWTLFFGRFHPLIVHLPIGILFFAALLNLFTLYKKNELLTVAVNVALLTGAMGATLAALSGYFLSTAGGYDRQLISWHKWIGITAAFLAFFVWLIRVRKNADPFLFRVRLSTWLWCICILLIIWGGHLGGKMTHGADYLTRYMPAVLRSVFGKKADPPDQKNKPVLDSVIAFKDIIQPIFNARCVGCHNAAYNKGDLNLTTVDGIRKGGKSGNTVVAGDVEKSELVHRITGSSQRVKFMPADNRPPLTNIEIYLIKWWIQTGAGVDRTLLQTGADEKTKFLIATYLDINAENDKEIILPEVPVADSGLIGQLTEMKIIIRPLAIKSNLLEASFVMVQQADPSQILSILGKLSGLRQQLYQLNVSNCGLTREAIKIIAGFNRLHRLEIQKNQLTDDAIEALSSLQQLVILNAGQNPLTDKSISTFKKLTALKKLNLWQTGLTAAGYEDLEEQLSGTVIDR